MDLSITGKTTINEALAIAKDSNLIIQLVLRDKKHCPHTAVILVQGQPQTGEVISLMESLEQSWELAGWDSNFTEQGIEPADIEDLPPLNLVSEGSVYRDSQGNLYRILGLTTFRDERLVLLQQLDADGTVSTDGSIPLDPQCYSLEEFCASQRFSYCQEFDRTAPICLSANQIELIQGWAGIAINETYEVFRKIKDQGLIKVTEQKMHTISEIQPFQEIKKILDVYGYLSLEDKASNGV